MPIQLSNHKKYIQSLLLDNFPHTPTLDQEVLLGKFADFILSKEHFPLFILKGYAGTGKTTIVKTLVATLPELKLSTVLMAPTGRAAKVLANYTGQQSYTIHRKIFKFVSSAEGNSKFIKLTNKHSDTIFIVDEASMIANQSDGNNSYGSINLLDDLIAYVYNTNNCKLIIIGDTAQLPPVGLSVSPALDPEYMQSSYDVSIDMYELKNVVRQKEDSGILFNATNLRQSISTERSEKVETPNFSVADFKDIIRLTGENLEDMLNDAYSKDDIEDTIVVCRSNKRANLYNEQIRKRILFRESDISTGDYLMVVKNNYFWLPEESKAGFIANGDIIELQRIRAIKELYGFRFADITFRMVDYPDEPSVDAWIILDTLTEDTPCLSYDQSNKLYRAVNEDYAEIPSKSKRYMKVKSNPQFNALQVKFAYAVTCHKAQGGQWKHVFVDQGYLTTDMINRDFLRWLYTALSRATKKLYLINFKSDFYSEAEEEF